MPRFGKQKNEPRRIRIRNRNSVVQIRIRTNTRKTIVIAANLTLFKLALVSNDIKIFIKFLCISGMYSTMKLLATVPKMKNLLYENCRPHYSDPDPETIFRAADPGIRHQNGRDPQDCIIHCCTYGTHFLQCVTANLFSLFSLCLGIAL
jgi:hypothetical protein